MNEADQVSDAISVGTDEDAPFVSYAQNFEDVMLWRALGHVENGFYVDVGAQDPTLDSVSKAFYDRGWSGVDIEPVPKYADLLRVERPRNRVLECALSDRAGREPLFVFDDSGLSTLLADQAARNNARLGLSFRRAEVEVRTLRDVLAEVSRDVHWLKIDVEGAEEDVLRSWHGSTVLPWIVVVEATRPNEREPSHGGWEPLLVEAGYVFVYFDGLNRFYVAPEHTELRGAFASPPNVFDRFTLASVDRLGRSFVRAERYAKSLEAEVSRQHDAIRIELDAQRSTGRRRDEELREAAVYAASLRAELAACTSHARSLEEELGLAKIEIESQRDVAERRAVELGQATAYAVSLETEIEARGVRLAQLDEELLRVRQAVEQAQPAFDAQRALASRRDAELQEAGMYARSLEAELARVRAALEDAARDASSRANAFAEVERYARSLEAEVGAQSKRIGETDQRHVRELSACEGALADLRRSLDAAEVERGRLSAMADRERLAAEAGASALAREAEALRAQSAQWSCLALQQLADARRQLRALADLVRLPDDSPPVEAASTIGDVASAYAARETMQTDQSRLNAEVGRIAAELGRHEQRWYRRLNRRFRADRSSP